MVIPQDVQTGLAANDAARRRFESLPPSHQREYLQWIEQAKRLPGALARFPISRLVISPQRRAVQTAQPVAEALGLPVEIDERLAEYDRDMSYYVPIEQASEEDLKRLLGGYLPGGVDQDAFIARVVAGIDDVVASADHADTVAVFTHGGVIDSSYRGEIVVLMTTLIDIYEIRSGDRIAQLVPTPVLTGPVTESTELTSGCTFRRISLNDRHRFAEIGRKDRFGNHGVDAVVDVDHLRYAKVDRQAG